MRDIHLQGEHVTLRPLVEGDLPRLLEILMMPEIAQWWWGYDLQRLHAETFEDPDVTSLAVELEPYGFIGLVMVSEETDPYYRHAGIDITLDPGQVNRGLGTDALRTVARYLFRERGHHRITIDPAAHNERAIAAYRKVGFRSVGTLRQYELGPGSVWHDALLMDMLPDELT